ncbi:hypothetical protein IQ260_24310 [Leptolyngbya cf. ectocarpi LEGE 11479]|uniref:Uncharacterized protein n=1 Tax=Leptolyngbya cf. ectocarpi LEGE 11479 TaxID=1828722 RepID=A0A929FA67_LEPEC|nr:hypothetical protein [Leptolyngbya ectocarpi]MBE9069771.1 hypothetical protein [Leptolyngbya cf. ectocarpi LEGE 11479]
MSPYSCQRNRLRPPWRINQTIIAELASFKAAGQRRSIMRYKLELQAEMDTYGHLKQRRMEGGQQ